MKTLFSKQFILGNCGCYLEEGNEEHLDELKKLLVKDEYSLQEVVKCEAIPFKDRAWFLCHKTGLSRKQLVTFALGCAEIVSPIYNKASPNDDRVNQCLQTVQKWIEGEATIKEVEAAAADAAYAYAYAYNVAAAAAANAATANTANTAANAYTAAHVAYAVTVTSKKYIKQLEEYIFQFVK